MKHNGADENLSPTGQALERFRALLSPEAFARLEQELARPLDTAIRLNRLKTEPLVDVQRLALAYGWKLRAIPYCQNGWWVTEHDEPISKPIEHRMGYYYIQDAASMLPVSLFEIKDGETPLILDMAASPGGKTTHLVDRTLDRGLVIANDASRDRITMLRMVLQNWGAMNIAVTRFPGEKFSSWYPGVFDCVLLDAPCSMQNLRSTEARPMHAISASERGMLASRQARMLLSALQAVRVGGQVVYATCTLNPEEDEAVLDEVLRITGSAVAVRSLDHLLPVSAPGLEEALLDGELQHYDPRVRHALRLWPHLLGTSGFFAALLLKQDDLPLESTNPPQVSPGRRGLRRLKRKESIDLVDVLGEAYGFDFQPVMDRQLLSLWRHKDVIYAIPEMWERFSTLPFQAVGMRVAEESKMLIPSHEWVARFGQQFQRGIWVMDPLQAGAWLRGEDLPLASAGAYQVGQIVAVKDTAGRLYGRGKVLASRLRNLLPTRWVDF